MCTCRNSSGEIKVWVLQTLSCTAQIQILWFLRGSVWVHFDYLPWGNVFNMHISANKHVQPGSEYGQLWEIHVNSWRDMYKYISTACCGPCVPLKVGPIWPWAECSNWYQLACSKYSLSVRSWDVLAPHWRIFSLCNVATSCRLNTNDQDGLRQRY